MEFVPTGSEAKFNVAPPVAVSGAVPRLVDPSRNVTVPVGTLLPDWGATTAVRVTLCPGVSWVPEAVRVVVVGKAPLGTVVTVTLTAVDEEPVSLLSPPYTAVIEFVPTAREVLLNFATPLALSCAVPRLAVPSRNVTVPVGTLLPDWGATVAVKVTLCPGVSRVAEAERDVVVPVPTVL